MSRSKYVARLAAVWLACAAFWSQQSITVLALRNRLDGANVRWAVLLDTASAGWWFIFALGLVAATSRWPIAGRRAWSVAAAYVLVSGPVTALHLAVTVLSVPPHGPLISPTTAGGFIGDFVVFWVVVGLGHLRRLRTWLGERDEINRQLETELREMRHRAAALQTNPDVALRTLEQLRTLVVNDAARAERVLARLADYLRLALNRRPAESGPMPDERGWGGGDLNATLSALEHEVGAALAEGRA